MNGIAKRIEDRPISSGMSSGIRPDAARPARCQTTRHLRLRGFGHCKVPVRGRPAYVLSRILSPRFECAACAARARRAPEVGSARGERRVTTGNPCNLATRRFGRAIGGAQTRACQPVPVRRAIRLAAASCAATGRHLAPLGRASRAGRSWPRAAPRLRVQRLWWPRQLGH